MISSSIIWSRLLSIIFSLIAIKIFTDFSRKLFSRDEHLLVSSFFALHPFLIWTSLEIRCYSLVILLAVLLLKFFWKAFIEEERNAKNLFVFGATALTAIYTQYYLGFMIAAEFLALLFTKRFNAARYFILSVLPVGFAILPLLGIIAKQFEANSGGYESSRSGLEGARLIWNHLLTHFLPTELSAGDEPSLASVLRKWLIRFTAVFVFLQLFRTKFRLIDDSLKVSGVIISSLAILLFATYFLVGETYMALRHTALLLAPMAIFGGLLILRLVPKKVWIGIAVIYLISFCYSYKTAYPELAKRGDWIRVAGFIRSMETPNQPIVVFRAHDALTLKYQYKGANKILPDEKFLDWWREEDSLGNENARRSEISFVVSEIPKDAKEIWLATEGSCQEETTRNSCRPLENFVEENYTVIEDKYFYRERIRLLRKR